MPISQFYYPSEIELVTGFGKEQLRKWRQRFGFPPKESNFSGETAYSLTTVNQLLLIKRLLEAGFRPAQVVGKLTCPDIFEPVGFRDNGSSHLRSSDEASEIYGRADRSNIARGG